jgi:uncharacterized OB-fold protein
MNFCPVHFVELDDLRCPKCGKVVIPATMSDFKTSVAKTLVDLSQQRARVEDLLEKMERKTV